MSVAATVVGSAMVKFIKVFPVSRTVVPPALTRVFVPRALTPAEFVGAEADGP